MTTILFPIAAPPRQAEFGSSLPVEVQEVAGRMIMDYALQPFLRLRRDTSLIALVHNVSARESGLDVALSALTDKNIEFVRLNSYTRGSVCTCLMAADHIALDSPLVVASLDQLITVSLEEVFQYFEHRESDAGVITFPSRNPKFSYAVEQNGRVYQTAEKRPITSNALAGIYYFRRGSLFLEAAQKQLYKRVPQHQNTFYLSGTINELVIEGKVVLAYEIPSDAFHKFYTPYMLEVFANKLEGRESLDAQLIRNTERYVSAFNARDLTDMTALLSENVILNEVKRNRFLGKTAVMDLFAELFSGHKDIHLETRSILANSSGLTSALEFNLRIGDSKFQGVDVITWQNDQIVDMQAYFL